MLRAAEAAAAAEVVADVAVVQAVAGVVADMAVVQAEAGAGAVATFVGSTLWTMTFHLHIKELAMLMPRSLRVAMVMPSSTAHVTYHTHGWLTRASRDRECA